MRVIPHKPPPVNGGYEHELTHARESVTIAICKGESDVESKNEMAHRYFSTPTMG